MTFRPDRVRALVIAAIIILAGLQHARDAGAATIHVEAGGGHPIQALAAAFPGDHLLLQSGTHNGPATIDKPLTLTGDPGAEIDGHGQGSVITVRAADVTVQNLSVINSGISLEHSHAGIFLDKAAKRAHIEANRFTNNLFGVYIHGAIDSIVRDNIITGRRDLRMNERGNGVHLWNAPGTVIEGNSVRYGRDGIFATTSKRNVFRNNTLRDLRFAIHYMYTNHSEISGNVSEGNHVGFALMYSRGLRVTGNSSIGDRDHGFLINFGNRSQFADNTVRGAGKCVFIYNANRNVFRGNQFENCGIGIHFTAGSEGNEIYANAFISNTTQVKYVGTRWQDWSKDGTGNYWSDNISFDLNADGIADTPYKPNDMVDQVLWRHPLAKHLLASPAVKVLRWAQDQFPAIHPGGVIDSTPLMQPASRLNAERTIEAAG